MEKKRSTITTIARELGIAPSTVSRAFDPSSRISDATRSRITEYARSRGYVPNRAASRLTARETCIGIILNASYAPGLNELLCGIEDALLENYDYKLNAKVFLLRFTSDEEEADAVRRALCGLSDCRALIVSGITAPQSTALVSRHCAGGIPPVLLQSEINGLNGLFTSAHDPAASAVMAAEFLSCCLRLGKKRVALFTGNRCATVHSAAVRAFEEAAARLGLNITLSFDMKDNPRLLESALPGLLGANTADGIYITSGQSLPLCRYAKSLSSRPALVTFDTYPELNGYITDGTVKATIYQNLCAQAYNAFTLLAKYLLEGARPPGRFSPVPELVLPCVLPFYCANSTRTDFPHLNITYI